MLGELPPELPLSASKAVLPIDIAAATSMKRIVLPIVPLLALAHQGISRARPGPKAKRPGTRPGRSSSRRKPGPRDEIAPNLREAPACAGVTGLAAAADHVALDMAAEQGADGGAEHGA